MVWFKRDDCSLVSRGMDNRLVMALGREKLKALLLFLVLDCTVCLRLKSKVGSMAVRLNEVVWLVRWLTLVATLLSY